MLMLRQRQPRLSWVWLAAGRRWSMLLLRVLSVLVAPSLLLLTMMLLLMLRQSFAPRVRDAPSAE